MSANYAWIITTDHLADELETDSDVGVTGPRNASDANIARLEAGEGRLFRIYDDDQELYYTGRIVWNDTANEKGDDLFLGGESGESGFEPLDDFGRGNAGATDIKYKNAKGTWTLL